MARRNELGTATAALYGLPRDEFTGARNELAKRLRRDGRRPDAEKVKELRKPTAAAWIVNQVSRQARGDMKKLLSAGERMRKARTPTQLRTASGAEREAIARLLGRVEEVAGSQPAATIERVRETSSPSGSVAMAGEPTPRRSSNCASRQRPPGS